MNANEIINEKISFLTLSLIQGIAFQSLKKIYKAKIPFKKLLFSKDLATFNKLLKKCSVKSLSFDQDWQCYIKTIWDEGAKKYYSLEKAGVSIVFENSDLYPDLLRKIDDPPLWLFVKGDPKVLSSNCIAIVGLSYIKGSNSP